MFMKHWLTAFRLRTLPLALSSIGMGAFLAAAQGSFKPIIFVLCLLTTAALQILSNLANDYGDTIHGADNDSRKGPARAVQAGLISRQQMFRAIVIFVFLSFVLGLTLLYISDLPRQVLFGFLVLGLAAIFAAILYTNGKLPYGYIGLGDFFVFLFFGCTAVIGTYYLQTGQFSWDLILPATSCGLLTVAVLNINNIRDIDSDKIAGKFSIPVRLGLKGARIYHCALLIVALLTAAAYILLKNYSPNQFLILLALPLLFINAKAVSTKPKESLDPHLKQMAIINVIFVILFGLSLF